MRQPILAFYGIDEKGKPYLHVKVFKAKRVFGEILILSGDVQLRCRECYRWYRVQVPTRGRPHLIETPEPESDAHDDIAGLD